MNTPKITLWEGRPITEMTREELIEALEWCGEEFERLRQQRQHEREVAALFREARNRMNA